MSSSTNFTSLKNTIAVQFPKLSKRLKQVAEYALANPNEMALETIATIAKNAEVQPSTLIRFAKSFGFDGFSDMQKIFKKHLVRHNDYKDRIRAITTNPPNNQHSHNEFFMGSISSIEELSQQTDSDQLKLAVQKLKKADTIYLAGFRRAFPVAAYFQYAISHLDKKVVLLHGLGGMLEEQARTMNSTDVLLATSFREHSEEVIHLVNSASSRNIPIVSITDSTLGPVASKSDICLQVTESKVQGFRSLSATMCLALIIVVGLGKESVLETEQIMSREENEIPA